MHFLKTLDPSKIHPTELRDLKKELRGAARRVTFCSRGQAWTSRETCPSDVQRYEHSNALNKTSDVHPRIGTSARSSLEGSFLGYINQCAIDAFV